MQYNQQMRPGTGGGTPGMNDTYFGASGFSQMNGTQQQGFNPPSYVPPGQRQNGFAGQGSQMTMPNGNGMGASNYQGFQGGTGSQMMAGSLPPADTNPIGKVAGYHSTSQKFTGNMHPDSTIFKNLPGGNQSLASQGILRKDPSRLNTESLGMNPNVRVEDEYIDNLMKQIHFMNLEVDLLKKKQDESKDVMGIRALMMRDKSGYTDHIIEANTKFLELLQNQVRDKIELEDRLLKAREREQQLTSLRDLHKVRFDESGKSYQNLDEDLRRRIKELRDKVMSDREFRAEIEANIDKMTKQTNDAKIKNDELTKYVGEKNLFDSIQKEIDEDEDRILLEQIGMKGQLIEATKETRDMKLKAVNEDSRLRGLKEAQTQLLAELTKKQIEASDTEYTVVEIEERKKLAIAMKDKDAQDRKKLHDEYEILKEKLEDEIRKNNDRIQKKLRESSFDELGKREIVLRKTQEELNGLKVQYEKIHKEFKNFKLDELRKTTYLNKIKAENDGSEKQLNALEITIKELQPKVDEYRGKVQNDEQHLKDGLEREMILKSKLYELEETHKDLNARVTYINKNFNLDDLLKGVNLEELKKVMDSNLQINTNITELLNKWDNMRKFGRGQTDLGPQV